MAITLSGAADGGSWTSGPSVTAFTMMGWFSPISALGDYQILLRNGYPYTNDDYDIRLTTSLELVFSNSAAVSASAGTLTVGTWYHVALKVSGTGAGQAILYLNGVQAVVGDGDAGPFVSEFHVGAWYGSDSFLKDFNVAGVKLWNAVLSDAQIAQEMRQYLPCYTTNIRGCWPMLSSAERGVSYGASGSLVFIETVETVDGPPIPWAMGRHRGTIKGVGSNDLRLWLDEPEIGGSIF